TSCVSAPVRSASARAAVSASASGMLGGVLDGDMRTIVTQERRTDVVAAQRSSGVVPPASAPATIGAMANSESSATTDSPGEGLPHLQRRGGVFVLRLV